MGAAYFYHLTQRPLEATLPMLVEKARAAGWRVAVRAPTAERLEWLDEKLWMGEGFLPHAVAGGDFDAEQPVLLTTETDAANAATCLMTIDGAETSPEEVAALERVCILFDGGDAEMVEAARAQWRNLTKAGTPAQYWSEESGRWQKLREA